jgi:protein tyrosine/serine phosphatase
MTVPFENSYWVAPGQFLAGEHPIEIEPEVTQARLIALLDAGVRTFVNLTEQREKMSGYSQSLRQLAAVRGIQVQVLRIPTPDRAVPMPETLRAILDTIDEAIAHANPVFVHCFAGIGRTGTVVGCYLMRHGRATGDDVIARISELRRHMPGGRETSPHTPEQIQLVRSWKTGS